MKRTSWSPGRGRIYIAPSILRGTRLISCCHRSASGHNLLGSCEISLLIRALRDDALRRGRALSAARAARSAQTGYEPVDGYRALYLSFRIETVLYGSQLACATAGTAHPALAGTWNSNAAL